MTTVSAIPCSMVTKSWTFTASAPSSIPQGVYVVKYTKNGVSKYLSSPTNMSNVILVNTPEESNPFYVRWYGDKRTIATTNIPYIDSPTKMYCVLVGRPDTALQVSSGYAESPIVFAEEPGLGFSIYNTELNVRYVPDGSGVNVVPANSGTPFGDQVLWEFMPQPCPPQNDILESGQFFIKHSDTYLRSTQDSLLTIEVNPPTPANVDEYIWTYDKDNKKLYNCIGSGLFNYIAYNPNLSFTNVGQVVEVSKSASSTVDVLKAGPYWSIILDANTQSALASILYSGKEVPIAASCQSTTAVWSFDKIDVPEPEHIAGGVYKVQIDSMCLKSDGTLSSECGADSMWVYNGGSLLQNVQTQKCLVNLSENSCDSKNLTVGDCGSNGSARFVLGVNGQLFDPVLKLCYTPTPTEGYMPGLNYGEGALDEDSYVWAIPVVVVVLLLLGLLWMRHARKI